MFVAKIDLNTKIIEFFPIEYLRINMLNCMINKIVLHDLILTENKLRDLEKVGIYYAIAESLNHVYNHSIELFNKTKKLHESRKEKNEEKDTSEKIPLKIIKQININFWKEKEVLCPKCNILLEQLKYGIVMSDLWICNKCKKVFTTKELEKIKKDKLKKRITWKQAFSNYWENIYSLIENLRLK